MADCQDRPVEEMLALSYEEMRQIEGGEAALTTADKSAAVCHGVSVLAWARVDGTGL